MAKRLHLAMLFALLLAAVATPTFAQDTPAAEIVNDEGGPVIVQGVMDYTFPTLTNGVAQPIVLLEDQAGFVDRDFAFFFPAESQVLGNFTTDFFTSPVSYNINLPIEPRGTLVDVDGDDTEDTGVMIYTPAYWNNAFGDPFLDKRDAGGAGWSTAYAGTDTNPEAEVQGGFYLIYAPEEEQGFPAAFGDDGLLFTEDDPIVTIPQGWTIVDLNTDPFTFDRSREANIDLLEPVSLRLNDFSDMSYTEAFDAAIDLMRRRYSFTELKGINWDELNATYRPLVVEAEENADPLAFKLAMRDLSYELPDGHVSLYGSGASELSRFFSDAISGGIGMNIQELDDTRVIVSYVLPDSPADIARISPGDEVVAIDGEPIQEVLDNTFIFGGYSTDEFTRIQQLRYAVRRPIGVVIDVTYRNGESGELNTTRMVATDEVETFNRTSTQVGFPDFVGPVEFELLESGYAYVQITSFNSNEVLTVQDWEFFLSEAIDRNLPGIIVDMRFNGGGSPRLANQLAAYFYEEETIIGYRATYNDETNEFFVEEDAPTFLYPSPDVFRYDGQIALLVSPACASACETFSYAMSQLENVTVVGQYATAGLGGGVNDYFLPEDLRFRYTVNRGLNADQEIHIEGVGIVPDVRVPINEETVFAEGDIVLETAIDFLDGALNVPFTTGAELSINDEADGTLLAGERVRHTIVGPSPSVDVVVETEADVDIVLRIYDEDGRELLAEVERNDFPELPLENTVVGDTLIVEIATQNDDSTTAYTITTTADE